MVVLGVALDNDAGVLAELLCGLGEVLGRHAHFGAEAGHFGHCAAASYLF